VTDLAVADESRCAVEELQREIAKLPQAAFPTEHIFHGGMYCRQVWRPAGALIVGKVHKKEHFYMVVEGTILVTSDDGPVRVTGPHLMLSKPGTKRAVFAETDALCMTFHRVDSDNVADAEAELVEDDPSATYGIGNQPLPPFVEVLT
jgi:mannose-6-phosphate isomerase-like protein (cupin superfamily)